MIFSIGDIMIDAYFQMPNSINPRTDTHGHIDLVPGGSAANFAVWTARQGAPSAFVGRVGDDFLGHGLDSDLRREGVQPFLSFDRDFDTGRVGVMVSPGGERNMVCDRRANTRLCPDDVPEQAIADAEWLHVSGYAMFEPDPRRAARRAIEIASEAGVPVSIDPAAYAFIRSLGAAEFVKMCKGATVIVPNRDEAAALTGLEGPEEMTLALAELFPVVALKLGGEGSMGMDRLSQGAPAEPVFARPVDVEAIDTNGAGDAFNAGFVFAYLKGEGLEAALHRGNELGAHVVGRRGAR